MSAASQRPPYPLLPRSCRLLSPTKEISMDPLTSVVTALAAGAAAALQSTVEQGVKDGYAALKRVEPK
jgi:hypothetical protein